MFTLYQNYNELFTGFKEKKIISLWSEEVSPIPILSQRNQLLSGTVSTDKKPAPVSNVIANKQIHFWWEVREKHVSPQGSSCHCSMLLATGKVVLQLSWSWR